MHSPLIFKLGLTHFLKTHGQRLPSVAHVKCSGWFAGLIMHVGRASGRHGPMTTFKLLAGNPSSRIGHHHFHVFAKEMLLVGLWSILGPSWSFYFRQVFFLCSSWKINDLLLLVSSSSPVPSSAESPPPGLPQHCFSPFPSSVRNPSYLNQFLDPQNTLQLMTAFLNLQWGKHYNIKMFYFVEVSNRTYYANLSDWRWQI